MPTQIADRFLLERPAGAGGMGTVYRALDRVSGAPVALKLAADGNDALRARALAEADALTALDHPAIVRLVAHGLALDGRPYLAMEWLDGEDLAARLERGPLTVAEAALLGARAAAALAAAHARGVVHRDIKPSNLFLPGGDVAQVKLVDFGIARFAGAWERLTATGALVGTPSHMAPEQATGQRDVGPPADLFALGAVLFECLAGRPAFRGDSVMALLAKVVLDEPPRLDTLRADVPPAFAALVARLLAKAPVDRPTAAEVAAALAAPERAAVGAPAAEAITCEEQRLVCVLLARAAPEQAAPAPDIGAESTLFNTTAPAGSPTVLLGPGRDALDRLRAVVAPLGGRADRLLNGALVASWRAVGPPAGAAHDPAGLRPDAPRDQAARAARAALQARQQLPGAALALASGLTERRDALPLGPALERAAALLDAGEPLADVVLLDDVLAGLLDARFELAPSPAGLELLAERALDQEEARLLLGRSIPCVGRERELRAVGDLIDECVAEPVARAVLVTARPGTGKSRLRRELLRLVRLRGERGERGEVDVWMAGGDELGAGSPFALLGAALQHAAGVRPGDPLEQRRARLEQRAARHVAEPERARVAAFLGEIAAAPFPAEAHPLLAAARRNPAMMAEQVRRAWLDLLAAETAAHPVLLVLEDLHWGDTPSVQLAGAALEAQRERPFMILALARPEVRDRFPDLWAGRDVQELRLGGLTRRAAAQLIRHALPDAGDALVQRLVDRADGNAFYLEELIRAVAAGRGDALPETVAAMVQARLDALAPDDRRLLRAASIFGEVFWERGVFALLGVAEQAPAAAQLDSLVAREILVRRAGSRFPGEQELAFRHALLCDGACATFTDADRARGHRLAALWLENAGEDDPLILATHYERAAAPARAAACYHRAAERALAGNDPRGALAHAERALALGPEDALRPQVLHALMTASWFGGRLADAERWAAEVLSSAPRGSGLWCSAAQAKLLLLTQRADAEAVPFAADAVEGVEPTPENAGPLLRLLSSNALILGLGGHAALAEPYRARAEAIAEAFGGSIEPGSLGIFYFSRGRLRLIVELSLELSLRDAEQALHCFEAAGDRLYEELARFAVGNTLWELGAFERAEEALRRAVEGSVPDAHSALAGRACLALVLADRGALEEAVREATRTAAEARRVGDGLGETAGRFALVYALLRQGDAVATEREARAVLAERSGHLGMRGEFQAVLADARLAQGKVAEALSLARELSGADAQCSKVTRLLARPVEVEALLAAGEREEARAVLAEAHAEIVAIAARIEDAALRESFLARGPLSARLLRLAEAEGIVVPPPRSRSAPTTIS